MKNMKSKYLMILLAMSAMFCAVNLGNITRAYGATNLPDQPLTNVHRQAPIDGEILLPYHQFTLSANNEPTGSNNHVFFYRCPQHTGGAVPTPNFRNASGSATLKAPGSMSKTGYTFIGWRNGSHIFHPFQMFHSLGDDTHFYFYAVWAPTVYLTFNNYEGTARIVRRAAGTQMRTLPAPRAREGYVFLGWFSTPDDGGTRLNAFSTVPNDNTTYWARWSTPFSITIYYENLTNVDTDSARNFVDESVNGIKGLFLTGFGIDLVQRPDTTRYEPALNQVGTAAPNLMDINPSSYNTIIFRFVNFPLNEGRIAGSARPLRGMEGTTQMHLGDMVVTTMLTPEMFRRAVVHEISHIFGAHDCGNFGCVMDISRFHTIHDRWCASCRSDIHNYLYIRRRNNPQL